MDKFHPLLYTTAVPEVRRREEMEETVTKTVPPEEGDGEPPSQPQTLPQGRLVGPL